MCDGHQHQGSCCSGALAGHSTMQTLDELDFERGIWTAALRGDIPKLEELSRKGKVMQRDSFEFTALHYAVRSCQTESCRVLLEYGADPLAKSCGGVTPLHRAAYVGKPAIMKMLLAKIDEKLDLSSVRDQSGRSPIDVAESQQHEELVSLLRNRCS